MKAYYNEYDPFAAAWLRELIKANLIANGDVDDRSINDVRAKDLAGYTQCHFFAGIGVWSYALRQAGWPDNRPVWTGSCPCQPFSAAGKQSGFKDDRHLWPIWFPLIRECKPNTIFGEQVASKDALTWLDLVSTDLEGANYAVGAVDSCAAGYGAPHIRQRLYWVADSAGSRLERSSRAGISRNCDRFASRVVTSVLAHNPASRRREECPVSGGLFEGSGEERVSPRPMPSRPNGRMANSNHTGLEGWQGNEERSIEQPSGPSRMVGGFWRNSEWLWCRDQKYRPVEPGSFPLAHGATKRVGRLRGYGNAIVTPQAKAFVEAFLDYDGL